MSGDPVTVFDTARAEKRFWVKVAKTETCWLWNRKVKGQGELFEDDGRRDEYGR